MKEQILNYLYMKDILDRYGIKHRGSQFCCPFHGTDKHPSAKAYEKSFYCFNCGKTRRSNSICSILFQFRF